jgi:hypothetical protein
VVNRSSIILKQDTRWHKYSQVAILSSCFYFLGDSKYLCWWQI